jgi:SAM-dependent methyltransferase
LKARRSILLLLAAGAAAFVIWRVRDWRRIARLPAHDAPGGDGASLAEFNRRFYDGLWSQARLVSPERFNTWPVVRELAAEAASRLEIGPGLRPRLPLRGTDFVDLSAEAVAALRVDGARAGIGTVTELPGPDAAYDLVCALDIVEHVEDDAAALREIARVLRPGGRLLLSAPLHPDRWTPFDDIVGHSRRYDPEVLRERLAAQGFEVERSAVYGMQPRSSRLVDFGMRCLRRRPERAMWYYSHVLMPLGLFFQTKLQFEEGFLAAKQADEVLMVCKKNHFYCKNDAM